MLRRLAICLLLTIPVAMAQQPAANAPAPAAAPAAPPAAAPAAPVVPDRWFVIHYTEQGRPIFAGPHPTLEACETVRRSAIAAVAEQYRLASAQRRDLMARRERARDSAERARSAAERPRPAADRPRPAAASNGDRPRPPRREAEAARSQLEAGTALRQAMAQEEEAGALLERWNESSICERR